MDKRMKPIRESMGLFVWRSCINAVAVSVNFSLWVYVRESVVPLEVGAVRSSVWGSGVRFVRESRGLWDE